MLSFKKFLFENQYEGLLPTGMVPGDSAYIHHGDLMVGGEYHPNIKELLSKYGSKGIYHYNTIGNMHGFVLGQEAESMHAGQKEEDPAELQQDFEKYFSSEDYLNQEGR